MATNEIKPIELDVVNYSGKSVGKVTLANELFQAEINEYLVQKAVKVTLANQRQATAKTKGISEVAGSGKKPFRQKGTGRARAGSRRSPIWVGGATIFGPTGKQNYKLKQNKQEHFIALASVLTDKAQKGNIIVVESEKFDSCKTKDFVKALKDLKIADKKVLFVINAIDENLLRAFANVNTVTMRSSIDIAVYDVLYSDVLVLTKSVVDELNSIFTDEIIEEEEAK